MTLSMRWSVCLLVASVSWMASCGGDPPPEPVTPGPTAPPPAATDTEAAGTPSPTTFPIPTEGDAANHFLDAETLFAAQQPFHQGFVYAEPSKLMGPPGQDGKARLWGLARQKEIQTQHYWRTRRAKPEEVAVGQLALVADKKGPDSVYMPPGSVKEAYGHRWWIARVVSVRSRAEGYVLVSGNYRVSPEAIRLLEGDKSPSITKQGAEDAHFIGEEHWFVSPGPLPDKGFGYVNPAVPVKPDKPLEGGEGRFIQTDNGKLTLTSNAWQTRKATRAEIKKGQLVVLCHVKTGSTYRAPKTRAEALLNRWWAVKIESTKNLAKGTVGLEGGYEAAVDGLRVIK